MRLLGVTEEKLGKAMSVDGSLINKWKSGKRAIAPGYLDSMMDALARMLDEADEAVKKRAVSLVLSGQDTHSTRESIEEYLFNDSIPLYNFKDTQNKIFSYLFESIEEGAEYFFKYSAEEKGGTLRVYLSSADDLSSQMIEGIAAAERSNKKAEVILCAAGNGAGLFGLLDLTFGKGCTLNALSIAEEDKGFLISGGGAAVTYFRAPGGSFAYCEFFNGGVRAAYLEAVFAEKRRQARQIFSKALIEDGAGAFSKQTYEGTTYVISARPEFLLLGRETVKAILKDNNITGAAGESAADAYLSLKNIYIKMLDSGGVSAAFYPYEKEKREKSMRSGVLSAIVKKEIYLLGAQFDTAIGENSRALADYTGYAESRITEGVLPENFGCLVREYGAAIVWKHGGQSTRFFLAEDPLCSGVVCRSAQAVWSGLPTFSKPLRRMIQKHETARLSGNRV